MVKQNITAPFFSIITACLNSAATIDRCLRSLYDQSFRRFEIIIIDGNSSDGTIDIIKTYTEKFSEIGIKVTLKSEPDNGIYDALNKGVSLCNGAVIGILNSDDYYEPGTLQLIYNSFTENDHAEIVYGLLRQWMNGQELVVRRYNYDYILSSLESGIESAAQHPACFVKKSVYEKIGLFDITFSVAADYDFLLRAKRAGTVFLPIDTIVSNFFLGGSSSKTSLPDRLEQRYRAQYKNGLLNDNEYRLKKRYLARVRFGLWRKQLMTHFRTNNK